jgi:hypothetical protein
MMIIKESQSQTTVIHSPIDGTVVSQNVDVGGAMSRQTSRTSTISKWGIPVIFKVDALPRQTFTGAVSQIRMNPTTVQRVVTWDTIIEFANPELKLFPGMTASVTIPVATVHNVLKLPTTALRLGGTCSLAGMSFLAQRGKQQKLKDWRRGRDSNPPVNVNSTTCRATDGM